MPTITTILPRRASTRTTIGACAHLSKKDYLRHDVLAAAKAVGIQRVRSNFDPGNREAADVARSLVSAGITYHATLNTPGDWRTPGAAVAAARAQLRAAVAAGLKPATVEPLNELDHKDSDEFAGVIARELPGLKSLVAEESPGTLLYGPALLGHNMGVTVPRLATALPGPALAALVARQSLHHYNGARKPEDPDLARGDLKPAGPATSFAERLALLKRYSPAPVSITETGWHNTPGGGETGRIDPLGAAHYLIRAYLAWDGLVDEMFIYELFDQPGATRAPKEQHFGLYDKDGKPKPAAAALGAMQRILADPAPNAPRVPVKPFSMATSGGPATCSRAYVKSGGSVFLALWQAWDVVDKDGVMLADPGRTEPVQLRFDTPHKARAFTLLDNAVDEKNAERSATTHEVNVGAMPIIVRIRPS